VGKHIFTASHAAAQKAALRRAANRALLCVGRQAAILQPYYWYSGALRWRIYLPCTVYVRACLLAAPCLYDEGTGELVRATHLSGAVSPALRQNADISAASPAAGRTAALLPPRYPARLLH